MHLPFSGLFSIFKIRLKGRNELWRHLYAMSRVWWRREQQCWFSKVETTNWVEWGDFFYAVSRGTSSSTIWHMRRIKISIMKKLSFFKLNEPEPIVSNTWTHTLLVVAWEILWMMIIIITIIIMTMIIITIISIDIVISLKIWLIYNLYEIPWNEFSGPCENSFHLPQLH